MADLRCRCRPAHLPAVLLACFLSLRAAGVRHHGTRAPQPRPQRWPASQRPGNGPLLAQLPPPWQQLCLPQQAEALLQSTTQEGMPAAASCDCFKACARTRRCTCALCTAWWVRCGGSLVRTPGSCTEGIGVNNCWGQTYALEGHWTLASCLQNVSGTNYCWISQVQSCK